MSNELEKLKREAKRLGTDPEELIVFGRQALRAGDFKSARTKFRLALIYNPRLASNVSLCYEDLLDRQPDNVNARLSLADLHLYLNEVEGAISELEEILDIHPRRADIYNILGKLYLKQGDIDSSITLLESAIKSGIKDTNLVEMLAGAYIEKDRIHEAVSLYDELLQKDAENKKYLRTLGQLLTKIGDYDLAADRYFAMLAVDIGMASEVTYKLEELRKQRPENIHIKETLAEAYVRAVRPTQAVSELEAILELDGSRIDSVISRFKGILDRFPDEPTTLKALARALTKKQSYSEAVAEYARLMRYSSDFIDDAIAGFRDILSRFPAQVHAHESLGDAFLKLGKAEDALIEYLEVMKLDSSTAKSIIGKCSGISKENPNMMLVHEVLGQAHVIAGEGLSAIEEAEFMIYLDKNYSPAHRIMGDAYMKLGNPAKAQGYYASALVLDPYNTDIHSRYAAASTAVLRGEIENLKKRIDEDPWRLGNHLDIAKLYLMVNDYDKGVKELQVAVKDSARAPFAHNMLGISFVEMGRFDLAILQFEKALELLPKELGDVEKTIRFNLGAAYEGAGMVVQAISEYEMVLSTDMEYPGLQSRARNLSATNPDSLRNKTIAYVMERYGERAMIGMWGPDMRHPEPTSELLNMSFGQEHNNSGFEHFIKGRFKGATEEFSLAAQLDPKFCPAMSNLSFMMLRDGNIEQAQTRLNLALTLEAGSAVLHNNMGVLHLLRGDLEAAANDLGKAIEIDSALSASYINLGDVMYMKGSAQTALSLWEKVKTSDPLSPIALKRLSYKTVKT